MSRVVALVERAGRDVGLDPQHAARVEPQPVRGAEDVALDVAALGRLRRSPGRRTARRRPTRSAWPPGRRRCSRQRMMWPIDVLGARIGRRPTAGPPVRAARGCCWSACSRPPRSSDAPRSTPAGPSSSRPTTSAAARACDQHLGLARRSRPPRRARSGRGPARSHSPLPSGVEPGDVERAAARAAEVGRAVRRARSGLALTNL